MKKYMEQDIVQVGYIYNTIEEFKQHKKEMESAGWDFITRFITQELNDKEVEFVRKKYPDIKINEGKNLYGGSSKYIYNAKYQKLK